MNNFKVGDFVTGIEPSSGAVGRITYVSKQEDYFCVQVGHVNMRFKFSELIPWTPQQGEWCWFYPEEYPLSYILAKFDHYENALYWAHTEFSDRVEGFPCCEPFVGKLPSFIKELT